MSERVRPARSADVDGVWRLAREFATSFTPVRESFDATWAELVQRHDAVVLVAEEDDIIGYLLAFVHPTFLANGPVAWIEEVMVDTSHRRRGVGRRLMNAAETWAQEGGAAYVALASRRAGAFHTAVGYEDSAVFYRKLLSWRRTEGTPRTRVPRDPDPAPPRARRP